MGLITMGYGHLTVITMGLGNSVRIVRQRRHRRQWGNVTFENIPLIVTIEDTTPEIKIEELDVSIDMEVPNG
uniref:Uncharacterized protein n=1 Tax=viral metagenome TaxID=1070528 RepID=A0A6M3JSM6_9ZZZZ